MAGISVAAVGASVAVYFYTRRLSVCGFNGRGDGSAFRPNTGLFKGAHKAPNSWLEGLFFFAEALRWDPYVAWADASLSLDQNNKLTPFSGSEVFSGVRYLHGETLGRWRTADLLIGLVYLSQRGYEDSPAADLASHGQVVGRNLDAGARRKLVVCAPSTRLCCSLLFVATDYVGLLIPCSEGDTNHCLLWQAELRGVQRCMRYCRILRERQAAAQAAVLQTMGIEAKDIYVQVHSMPTIPLHITLKELA